MHSSRFAFRPVPLWGWIIALGLLALILIGPAWAELSQNNLRVQTIRILAGHRAGDLPWLSQLTPEGTFQLALMKQGWGRWCGEEVIAKHRGDPCIWGTIVSLLVEEDPATVSASLTILPELYTQFPYVALLSSDIAYIHGFSEQAQDGWRQMLPVTVLTARAELAQNLMDEAQVDAYLAVLHAKSMSTSSTWRNRLSDLLANKARTSLQQRHLNVSAFYWEWAIQLSPDRADYHSALGQVYEQLGDWNAAAIQHRNAIRLRGTVAGYHTLLANALLASGQVNVAIDEYRVAVSLEPRNATFQALLARALLRADQPDEAAIAANVALELDPQNSVAQDILRQLSNRRAP